MKILVNLKFDKKLHNCIKFVNIEMRQVQLIDWMLKFQVDDRCLS